MKRHFDITPYVLKEDYTRRTIRLDTQHGRSAGIALFDTSTTQSIMVHRAVEQLARYFKREFQYDFVQYDALADRVEDPDKCRAFLFLRSYDADDVALGACCFRWREYTDHAPAWALQWIWLHPYLRDTNVLTAAWPHFEHEFGDFAVEYPLSRAMNGFLKKMRGCNEGKDFQGADRSL